MIAKFNSVEVPYVSSQIIDREFVGDRVRLAGGQMHQDFVSMKRSWELQTQYMKYSTYQTIISELESNNWVVDFWLDEFGSESNTVPAYISLANDERVQFIRGGTFHDGGRSLTLEVIEK